MSSAVQPSENYLIRHATFIAVAAVTAMMLAGLVTFYQQGEASRTARGWVTHTFEVRGHIRLLLSRTC